MRILFYFEPWIELGRPYLRYHNLRYQMGPQIRNLKNKYKNIEISILMGEGTYTKCLTDNFTISGVDFNFIKESELKKIFSDYYSASMKLNQNHLTQEEKSKLFDLIRSKLSTINAGKIEPDIIVSFLSPLEFLREYWPNTLILYAEFGIFSRIPFPRTFYLDAVGMFQRGFIRKFENQLQLLNPSKEQKEWLKILRKSVLTDGIKDKFPIKKQQTELSKFKYNVLLPLQFSKYFGFDGSCTFSTQFDYLIYVLENIDPSIGVVVTEHSSWEPVITEHNEEYLISKYPNLIIPREYLVYTNASQILMTEVDAVISVSSSVGLQALFNDKPLIAVGDSHLNAFNSGSIFSIRDAIVNYQPGRYDGALCFLLERYYPSERYFYNPEWAYQFYHKALEKFRSGDEVKFDFYQEIDKINSLYKNLIKDMRVDLFQIQNEKDQKENAVTHNAAMSTASDAVRMKIELLNRYSYISFDVFDTLIQRPFVMPHQLFLMMQNDVRNLFGDPELQFHKLRRYAEHICRTESSHDEIHLDEIYITFLNLIGRDSQYVDALIELEKSYEMRYCEPRPAGQELFQLCKKLGKKIIIISDFYLNKDFINTILNKCGYYGFEEIFVSSDFRSSKKSGILFDVVLKKLDAHPYDILHIGDNYQSDIENSKSRFINSLHIKKGSDLFFENKTITNIWGQENKRSVYPTESLQKTIGSCLGLCINHLYGKPEGRDINSAFSGNAKDLGYCIFGPMFLGFILDCIERSRKHKIDKLLFLSRDGNIMYQCFKAVFPYLRNLPEAQYILTSRRALSVACIENEQDIWRALDIPFKPTTLKNILNNKFGLEISKIPEEILLNAQIENDQELHPVHDLIKLKKAIAYYIDEILANAKQERYAANIYYQNIFKPGKKYALVDVGYTGTLQKYLEKITGISSGCLFLLTHLKAKQLAREGVLINGYLGNFIDHTDSLNLYNSHISLLETVCSSDENSLKKFQMNDQAVLPVTQEAIRKYDNKIESVVNIQAGIIKFIDDFMTHYHNTIEEFDFGVDFVSKWFAHYVKEPSKNDAVIFNNISHEDAYGGFETRYVVADVVNTLREKNNTLTKEEALALIKISDWKNGVRAILPARSNMDKKVPDYYNPIKYDVWYFSPENLLDSFIQKTSFRIQDKSEKNNKDKNRYVRLYYKLIHNPRLFFYDSNNPILKLIYKLFYSRTR